MDFNIQKPKISGNIKETNEIIKLDEAVYHEVDSPLSNKSLIVEGLPSANSNTLSELMNNEKVAAIIKEQESFGAVKGEEFANQLKKVLIDLNENTNGNIEGVKKIFSMVCSTSEAEQEVMNILDKYTGIDGGALSKGMKEMDNGLNDVKPIIADIKNAIGGTRNSLIEFFVDDAKALKNSFLGLKGTIVGISDAFKKVDENLDIVDDILGTSIPNTGKRICMTEAMIALIDKMVENSTNQNQNEILETVKTSLVSSNAILKSGMIQLVLIQKNQLITRLTQEATKFEILTRLPVTTGVNVAASMQNEVISMGERATAQLDELDDINKYIIDKLLTGNEVKKAGTIQKLQNIVDRMDWLQNRIKINNDSIKVSNENIKKYLPEFQEKVNQSAKGILDTMVETSEGNESIKKLISSVDSNIDDFKFVKYS